MKILRTNKTAFTPQDILGYIERHENDEAQEFAELWQYYKGRNAAIVERTRSDPDNPDNRTIVSYARKIVTTFAGYAYRPHYITYKASDPSAADFAKALDDNFKLNREHIRTNRAGRNIAIFGVAYELLYVEGVIETATTPTLNAVVKFMSVDPREMILLYDFSADRKKVLAIRFYKIDAGLYMVDVYDKTTVRHYRRVRNEESNTWVLQVADADTPNYFNDVPVVAYYFGDDMTGVIRPVLSLIDDYDLLMSDSMNEFDRFANAYLIMKKVGLTKIAVKKEPGMISRTLAMLRRRRVFENLPSDADISFLTKDIPSGYIEFMTGTIREQIHIQSHVPDFTSDKMAGASGIAIQRLLFDFENVVSAIESDFDEGLDDRINLIAGVFAKLKMPIGTADEITITHKRNIPLNLQEFAQTALTMSQAGFSAEAIIELMPDDIIPDKEAELQREADQRAAMLPDITALGSGTTGATTATIIPKAQTDITQQGA